MHQMTFQRVCAWSGIACVTLFFAAFLAADWIPPLAPGSSAKSIAHFYQHHATGIRIGGCLMLLSGMFYAAYSAVMSAQMRRIPGAHVSAVYLQLAAGSFACLTFLVPAMMFIATAFRPHRSPEITQAMNDMSYVFMVIPFPPFMAQNWAFAYTILTDRQARPVFPRWLGYLNGWAPLVYSPALLLPFFKTGPFDWRGIFVLWLPSTVFIAQFSSNTWMLLRAIDREQSELTSDQVVDPPSPRVASRPEAIQPA